MLLIIRAMFHSSRPSIDYLLVSQPSICHQTIGMVHKRLTGIRTSSNDSPPASLLFKYQSDDDARTRNSDRCASIQSVRRRKVILLVFTIPSLVFISILIFSSQPLRSTLGWKLGIDSHIPMILPQSEKILYDFVQTIRKPPFVAKMNNTNSNDASSSSMSYDVDNCPENPPENYPIDWSILDIISNWNPNNTTPEQRPSIYQGICRFHYPTDFHKALKYRLAEVPFILRDDPAVLQVVYRWNQPGYLERLLGDTLMETEYSTSNRLMYFKDHRKRNPLGWKPPMKSIKMTYRQWLEKANQSSIEDMGPDQPHWYFRVNAKDEMGHHPLYKEMPFFAPDNPNFYLVDLQDLRGINCRFGMMGNTAITHFDASRNFIVILGGERRYIISHPRNCPHLALYPRSHPSARHSRLNWSNPNLTEAPEFALANGNEVVLQAGDVLYLPTYWFHYIVSLDLNWQCNARSGYTREHEHLIRKCGF